MSNTTCSLTKDAIRQIYQAIDDVIDKVNMVEGIQFIAALIRAKDPDKDAIFNLITQAGVEAPVPTIDPWGFRFPIQTPVAHAIGYIRVTDTDGEIEVDHGYIKGDFNDE